jgi:hypothetical protein
MGQAVRLLGEHGLLFGVRLSDDCYRSVAVWAKGIAKARSLRSRRNIADSSACSNGGRNERLTIAPRSSSVGRISNQSTYLADDCGRNTDDSAGRAGRALIEPRGDAGHKHTQRTAKKRASVAVLRAFRVSSNQRFNNFEAFSREGHQLSLGLRLWINKND